MSREEARLVRLFPDGLHRAARFRRGRLWLVGDLTERWLPIPGYEGSYEVSDHGRVRSLDRVAPATSRRGNKFLRHVRGKLLSPHMSADDGYVRVRLWHPVGANPLVHSLVLAAFVGPCPADMQAMHADGTRSRNVLSNLTWGTPGHNGRDKKWHRPPTGKQNSKLSPGDVAAIRRALKNYTRGLCTALAREYGVSTPMISYIRLGYQHVDVVV